MCGQVVNLDDVGCETQALAPFWGPLRRLTLAVKYAGLQAGEENCTIMSLWFMFTVT